MKAFACILGVMLAVLVVVAPAAALVITFDDVVSVGNPVVALLDSHGYRFAGASLQTIDTPGTGLVSNGPGVYLAQAVAVPGITMTRVDGAPFALYDFDAAGLFVAAPGGLPNAREVGLLALQVGGGLLSLSYDLGATASFLHFSVPASWAHLESVTFTGLVSAVTPGALALDDVGVGLGPSTGSVGEPQTFLLALTAAVGLAAMLLIRRRLH